MKNNQWHLITIELREGPTGDIISHLIKLLMQIIKLRFVIVQDVYGASNQSQIFNLQEQENTLFGVGDFLNILKGINVFDWCDVFLFEEKPLNWLGEQDILYPPLVAQTDTTVRAVDGTYIYIYTQYDAIVSAINKNYEIDSITTDTLENLSFPE